MKFHLMCLIMWMFSTAVYAASRDCVKIFYDRMPARTETYHWGRSQAIFLENLLGHFPKLQQYVKPLGLYKQGDLDQCKANFYISTFFNRVIPKQFFKDMQTTKSSLIWLGYNTWQIDPENLKEMFRIQYVGLGKFDTSRPDPNGEPGFYRFVHYKGQVWQKYGRYENKSYEGDPENSIFQLTDDSGRQFVKAWIQHSSSGKKVPYIISNGQHWIVGDLPFTYMHEADRYLVFADALFDMLGEKPKHKRKPALLRIEDVHPKIKLWMLEKYLELAKKLSIPFAVAHIPIYSDPLGVYSEPRGTPETLSVNQAPKFVDWARRSEKNGGRFIYHGVTHQYEDIKNPHTGLSGDDYEFWDIVNNKPVSLDSPKFVVNRVETGIELMNKVGIQPVAFEVPHYHASPLDYFILGELFRWNVGRVVYLPGRANQEVDMPADIKVDVSGARHNGKRLSYFKDLKASYPAKVFPSGQMMPYEIYGDYFGQRIIPEILGNPQPSKNEQVTNVRTIERMIEDLRRNSVLRDVWASFFIHPYMMGSKENEGLGEYDGDYRPIEKLLRAIMDAGYEFIDLREWTKKHMLDKRPKTIEEFVPQDIKRFMKITKKLEK